MQDREYIGKLISEKRKSKGWTQQELALKLNISDKAISKWETCKSLPDYEMLKRIEEVLDIELLNPVEYKNQKKLKILSLIAIVIFLLLIFFTLYFKNNYNSFRLYKVSLNDNQYILKDGYLIVDKDEYILNLGNIINTEYPIKTNYTITIYYQTGQSKTIITSKENYEYIMFKDDELLDDFNNLYINIKYFDLNNEEISENLKLDITEIRSNNKIIYPKDKNNDIKINSNLLNLLENLNYQEKEENVYVKKENDSNITFDIANNLIYYEGIIDEYKAYVITPYSHNRNYKYIIYDSNNQIIDSNIEIDNKNSNKYSFKIKNIVGSEVEKILSY